MIVHSSSLVIYHSIRCARITTANVVPIKEPLSSLYSPAPVNGRQSIAITILSPIIDTPMLPTLTSVIACASLPGSTAGYSITNSTSSIRLHTNNRDHGFVCMQSNCVCRDISLAADRRLNENHSIDDQSV